jgi:pilus assembly protein CpaF
VHANSAGDVPARLEALAMAAGLSRPAAHSQMASAIDAVVHLGRDQDGLRRVREVAVLTRGQRGLVRAEPAVTFDADQRAHEHPGAELLGRKLQR